MRAQQAVAQPVESSHPHPARVDRQHRRDASQHFARGLVGEGHRENVMRPRLSGLDEPGDPRGKNARLAAAGTGENESRLLGKRDRFALLRIETGKNVAGDHVWRSIILAVACARTKPCEFYRGRSASKCKIRGVRINDIACAIAAPGTTIVSGLEMNACAMLSRNPSSSALLACPNRITSKLSSGFGMPSAANGLDVSTMGTRWKLM